MEGLKKPLYKINVSHMLLMAAWPQKKENNKETPVYCGKITPLALLFFRLSGTFPFAFSSPLFCFSSWVNRKELALCRRASADLCLLVFNNSSADPAGLMVDCCAGKAHETKI